MEKILHRLFSKQLIKPPSFLIDSLQYEVLMGSVAYGVSNAESDVDIYGFCIPPKYMVFPHLAGQIEGFGNQVKRFNQWQQHHVNDIERQIEYDFSIYSIIKFFQLCMENNPNIIDFLFVPRRCILYSTEIGEYVRENRKEFLHKGSWFKFKGYAYSQLHKMKTKNPDPNGKRYKSIKKYGYDVKFAYHVVRLLNEIEQILTEGDLDLQRNREQLKSIKQGEWMQKDIENYFESKEKQLEKVYIQSELPKFPNEEKIREILINCLTMYYGSLSGIMTIKPEINQILDEIIEKINQIKTMV